MPKFQFSIIDFSIELCVTLLSEECICRKGSSNMKKLVVMLSSALVCSGLSAYTPAPGSYTNTPTQMIPPPGGLWRAENQGKKYTNNVLTVKNYTQNPLTVWTTGFHETDKSEIKPGEAGAVITSVIDPSVRFDFLLPKTVTVTVHVASEGREVTKDISKHYPEHQAQFYRDTFALSVGELSNGSLVIREEKLALPAWSPQQQTTEQPEGARVHYPEK